MKIRTTVALEACKFWSAYCDSSMPREGLRGFLPRLIPTLVSHMVYNDDDESLADIKEDESFSDRDQDLNPRFHASRLHGSEAGKEDDDDDAVNAWNLRKCSTAGLDFLANAFGDDILPTLMPLVQENLSRTDDDAWKDREAAILCVGTIAEGCITGLYSHLPQIVSLLVPLLDDTFPLIRSITCQSLSRYSEFIVQTFDLPNGPEQFAMILMGLRRRISETNKRVQMAACSAFVTLEKEAAEQAGLEIILQHPMCEYGKQQRRNLWLISDMLVALADAVGRKLNQAKYLDILIPPLIMKWQQLHNSDKDIFPLVECFISITRAVGSGFSQFAESVFQNCIILIKSQKLAKVDPAAAGALYYKEFIVLSLELLSGLAEALGAGIESLWVPTRQEQANHLLDGKARQGEEHHRAGRMVWSEREAQGSCQPGPCWGTPGTFRVKGQRRDRGDKRDAQLDKQVPAERTDTLDKGAD